VTYLRGRRARPRLRLSDESPKFFPRVFLRGQRSDCRPPLSSLFLKETGLRLINISPPSHYDKVWFPGRYKFLVILGTLISTPCPFLSFSPNVMTSKSLTPRDPQPLLLLAQLKSRSSRPTRLFRELPEDFHGNPVRNIIRANRFQ